MQQDINTLAVLAMTDPEVRDSLLVEQELFVLRSASRAAKRHVSKNDDEWSVALISFLHAIESFDSSKGDFLPYADLLIRRGLVDYFRAQNRHNNMEIAVSPCAFDGNIEQECEETALQYAVASQSVTVRDITLKEEIEVLGQLLSKYQFSFFDLAQCSPQKAKTRQACAQAVDVMLSDPSFMAEMRQTRQLPIQKLQNRTGVQRKILERHRRYLIAATEILFGDFPALAEYLSFMRKEG